MYIYGEDPKELTVDHIDRNQSNNAISNLRLATASEQAYNRRSTNSSGYRGVWFNQQRNMYLAQVNFRTIGLRSSKYFKTAEEASAWYEDMRKQYGKEYCINSNIS